MIDEGVLSLQVLKRPAHDPAQGLVQIDERQTSHFVQIFGFVPPGLYIVGHVQNLVQKAHFRLSCGVAGDGREDFRVAYAELVLSHPGAQPGVNGCRSAQLVLGQGNSFLPALFNDRLIVVALGAVVEKARQLRLVQIISVAHRQCDAGKGYAQRVLVAHGIQF